MYRQRLNNDFICIQNLGVLNAKPIADTSLCLNWMKVTAITTFNWAIFHYHILMTLQWQFASFWRKSLMKSFISLFSFCLTTSSSIKMWLSSTLIIFEWARDRNVNMAPFLSFPMFQHESKPWHIYCLLYNSPQQQG